MNNKHALIIAFLITGLIASNYYFFQSINYQGSNLETVQIQRIIDADTFFLKDNRTIRLANINAPELSSINYPSSIPLIDELKNSPNSTIKIEIIDIDKYQRYLARVYTLNNEYLNLELVKQGFASKFLVQPSELTLFNNAELLAIQGQKGIWTHSIYYDCIKSEINKYDEYVIITNLCPSLKTEKWILKDESTKSFSIPDLNLSIGNSITLYSGEGQNDFQSQNTKHKKLFWNQKTNVWNNDRDSLYIFDSSGNIVHYNSYGY